VNEQPTTPVGRAAPASGPPGSAPPRASWEADDTGAARAYPRPPHCACLPSPSWCWGCQTPFQPSTPCLDCVPVSHSCLAPAALSEAAAAQDPLLPAHGCALLACLAAAPSASPQQLVEALGLAAGAACPLMQAPHPTVVSPSYWAQPPSQAGCRHRLRTPGLPRLACLNWDCGMQGQTGPHRSTLS